MSKDLLNSIKSLIAKDLDATDALIQQELSSDVPLIQTIGHHIVDSGGKRLRPVMLILAANCFAIEGTEHQELAAVLEFIHTATLLHDDVVDNSFMRRGQQTANAIWDNKASVLVGDFLYSRAFQVLARRANVPVNRILAHMTNALSEGEMLQLANQTNVALSEEIYYTIIDCKTAKFFAACCEIGAILADASPEQQQAMQQFGYHFGMAFQITDDVLDYCADSDTTGKNLGDDLSEGKMTLPLIYAAKHGSDAQRQIIEQAIRDKNSDELNTIQQVIHDTNALDYCINKGKEHLNTAHEALLSIPESPYRDALLDLSKFVVERDY